MEPYHTNNLVIVKKTQFLQRRKNLEVRLFAFGHKRMQRTSFISKYFLVNYFYGQSVLKITVLLKKNVCSYIHDMDIRVMT